MALPELTGKSLTTKDTKYTKEESGPILQAFFLRDFVVEDGLPVKKGSTKIKSPARSTGLKVE
jgi:hypothetical protein